jgi:hypothetical protein
MRSVLHRLSSVAIIGGCAIASPCVAADPPMYTAIDLGLVKQAGQQCDAHSIDEHDQVAGSVWDGVRWTGFVMPHIGGKARSIRVDPHSTFISTLTTTGLVGGSTSPKGNRYQPFIADSHGRQAQVLKSPGSHHASLAGLNKFGEGVGDAWVKSTNTDHAFITRPGRATVIDLGNSPSSGFAINDKGQSTGWMVVGNLYEVFLADRQGRVLDTGISGEGYAINNLAQIAGLTRYGHAFITGPDGKNAVDLGVIGNGVCETQLNAINNLGQGVGLGCIPGRDYSIAIVTNLEGTAIYPLESLVHGQGLELDSGQGINDYGKIVADGIDGHCYVLVPD